MARKRWSIEEKRMIVLELLTTNQPLAEICRKYNVQASMVYRWKEQFIEGGSKALAGNVSNREKQLEEENKRLKEMIADLALANELLKKGLRKR
ncbi:MAG: transposase [Candidatus Nitrosocaldaceae archaeon]|nr:MAG: transposase [Candidatus Nitrosocaldaceae archaeon]GIU71821.1 MAG: transposase [Candidatus Nitrosocaldaceae archaeon]